MFFYWRCEECGSMFAIKSRLITHQNTVHNEPVHPCQICDKSFKTLTLLKRHTVIHSRCKPYCCPFCNHSSNSQSNLTKHVRKIHSQCDFSYHKWVFPTTTITCWTSGLVTITILFSDLLMENNTNIWFSYTSGCYLVHNRPLSLPIEKWRLIIFYVFVNVFYNTLLFFLLLLLVLYYF